MPQTKENFNGPRTSKQPNTDGSSKCDISNVRVLNAIISSIITCRGFITTQSAPYSCSGRIEYICVSSPQMSAHTSTNRFGSISQCPMRSNSVAINTMMGLERRNATYSPHAHHEMYSSKREKSKRRRSRSRRLNHHKLEHHGVFTCAQCRTYYADNSNGQYLKEEKWFCNECLKKQQQFVYTEKRSKTKKKNKTTTTPPMTPPSSVEEEEEEEKKEEEVEEEEEDESDVVETVSTATQCGDQKVYHNNKMYHQMYHHHHLYAQQPYNLQNSWNAYYGNMFHNNQQQTAALNSYNI